MIQVLQSLGSYFLDNWPELVWIVAAAGVATYIAAHRARWRWHKREFLDRLNVTLTSVEDGKLRIRTIFELDCQQVFLNSAAAKTVVATAKRTTEDDPILPLPKGDCWQYLNAVLNEVSERFAAGHIKRDLGLPFERGEYLLCLTCERAGLVRTHKIRGMLVRKSLLTNLPEEEPEYESPWHVTRWDTLRHLAQQYEKNPHQFMEVEICL
jgi:hypothetical protein